jgi:hypothetical protein
MAYDLTNGSTTNHKSRTGANVPYTVEKTVSMADATTAKGSALANADVLEVIPVPANTLVHGAVAYVETVDSSTAATFDIDVAAGDDFIDGGDFNTVGWAAVGSNGLLPFGANSVIVDSADTIDVKLTSVVLSYRLTVLSVLLPTCLIWPKSQVRLRLVATSPKKLGEILRGLPLTFWRLYGTITLFCFGRYSQV